jgi:hypothetical protein
LGFFKELAQVTKPMPFILIPTYQRNKKFAFHRNKLFLANPLFP